MPSPLKTDGAWANTVVAVSPLQHGKRTVHGCSRACRVSLPTLQRSDYRQGFFLGSDNVDVATPLGVEFLLVFRQFPRRSLQFQSK